MYYAGNFHPEWGYLAPTPSFVRTARAVLVATAVGATAGAGVVISLVDRSAPGESSIAARTLAQPAPTSPAILNIPQAAQLSARSGAVNQPANPLTIDIDRGELAASDSRHSSAMQSPHVVEVAVERPVTIDALPANAAALPTPDAFAPASVPRKASKQPRRLASGSASRDELVDRTPGGYFMSANPYDRLTNAPERDASRPKSPSHREAYRDEPWGRPHRDAHRDGPWEGSYADRGARFPGWGSRESW